MHSGQITTGIPLPLSPGQTDTYYLPHFPTVDKQTHPQIVLQCDVSRRRDGSPHLTPTLHAISKTLNNQNSCARYAAYLTAQSSPRKQDEPPPNSHAPGCGGEQPTCPPEKEGALRFGRCEGRESVWLQYRQPGSRKKLVCSENGGFEGASGLGVVYSHRIVCISPIPLLKRGGGDDGVGVHRTRSVSVRLGAGCFSAEVLLNCIAGAGETSGPQAAQLTQPSAPPFSPPHHRCAPSTASEGGDDVVVSCPLPCPNILTSAASVTAVAYSTFPGGAECQQPRRQVPAERGWLCVGVTST